MTVFLHLMQDDCHVLFFFSECGQAAQNNPTENNAIASCPCLSEHKNAALTGSSFLDKPVAQHSTQSVTELNGACREQSIMAHSRFKLAEFLLKVLLHTGFFTLGNKILAG